MGHHKTLATRRLRRITAMCNMVFDPNKVNNYGETG